MARSFISRRNPGNIEMAAIMKERNYQMEAALYYARNGWRVFPLQPGGKEPLRGSRGYKDATTDENQIREWFSITPDANIGIATGQASKFCVVDIDGPEGEQSLREWEAEHGPLPGTLEQTTGREKGGRHLFFKLPFIAPWDRNRKAIRCRNALMPGIDIKADGGYVVAPPSIHPETGRQYSWSVGPDAPIAEAPRALLRLIHGTRTPRREFQERDEPAVFSAALTTGITRPGIIECARRYLAKCDPAIQGQAGHSKLLWAAGVLVIGFLLDDTTALELLWSEFNPRCVPQWNPDNPADVRDFERKVGEARKNPIGKPPGWLLDEYGLRGPDDAAILEHGARLQQGLLEGERRKAAIKMERKFGELKVCAVADLKTPSENDPQELLRHRFLGRTQGGLIVGPSGIGKSSLIMQMALCFSLGKQAFGLIPNGPLRILIIQAENDEGDMAEMRDGVLAGMRSEGVFSETDCLQAAESVKTVKVTTITGDGVGDLIRQFAGKDIDLVILDPAFAYLGGDCMQARDVTRFLREIINPVLEELNIGILIVHHANKPQRNMKDTWQERDFVYSAAGSAEWTNWPRCVITLRAHVGDVFELAAPKRGSRLQWKGYNGSKTTKKYLAHGSEGICWREASIEELQRAVTSHSAPVEKKTWLDFEEPAKELLQSQVWKVSEFEKALRQKFKLSENGTKQLRKLLENQEGFIHLRAPNKGASPFYLIGSEEDVLAEISRLKGEKKCQGGLEGPKGRFGSDEVPGKVAGDVKGAVKGTLVEVIGEVV